MKLSIIDREAYKRFRRARILETTVTRLRARIIRSDASLRALVGLLERYAGKEELDQITRGVKMKIKFVLTIKTDTAAFDEYPQGEVARILKKAASDIEDSSFLGSLYDINGNRVGQYGFE